MSDYEHEREQRQEADATQARVGRAKWSPWVWVVPAVAIVIAGWLVVRYGFFGGGDVTVRFVEARGLDRYSPVRFRGAKVGTVQKITIDEDLQEVVVRITMDASMSHALKANTRFWIVEPGLEGGGLGGLLSGTYVAIAPGDGDDTREFVGQEYPPVLAAPEAGKTFILEGAGAGAIAIGAPVQHEGIRVGRVLGTAYDPQRGISSVHVFVVQRFADRVRQSTRFYRAGGLTISFAGGGLSVGDASLSSLITAGIAFYTPEVLAGAQVANGTRFELYGSRAVAESSADGPHLTYLTYVPGPIHGLAPGTPVQMKGVQVGRVRDVRLRYVQARGVLETPVMLEIDPRQLEFAVTPSTTRADLRRMMNDALARLVQRGLRARLSSSLVLPGTSSVSLDVIAAPGTARLVLENDPPIIPASGAGAGIEGALASLNEIAGTIQSLPLREIAGDIRSAASRVNALVSDPRLESSLQRLNTSLAEIERVATITGQNIGPLAQSLRNAATSAEEAAKRVEELIGTSQRQNYDVAELIKELTRAAEAVRALATYLTENPDAVLKGRRE
jgi:paraquat-inducible protein B